MSYIVEKAVIMYGWGFNLFKILREIKVQVETYIVKNAKNAKYH